MKFFPLNTDTIAQILVGVVAFGFFIGGLLDVLDLFILKALLIIGFCTIFILATSYAIKNESKKNRLKDKPKDDSN